MHKELINELIENSASFSFLLSLSAAMFFGMLLGTERVIAHKSAGMRTYALVSMGACLFTIISINMVARYLNAGIPVGDPLQIPSMIISGIGFMGAGIIIFRDTSITGLTTASGLWVAAGIGMACGFNLFTLAFIATLLSLFVFIVLFRFEQVIKFFANKFDESEKQ